MEILTILVGGAGTTELALFDRDIKIIGGTPERSDDVDLLVEFVRSEKGFNMNVLGVYSESDALAASAS